VRRSQNEVELGLCRIKENIESIEVQMASLTSQLESLRVEEASILEQVRRSFDDGEGYRGKQQTSHQSSYSSINIQPVHDTTNNDSYDTVNDHVYGVAVLQKGKESNFQASQMMNIPEKNVEIKALPVTSKCFVFFAKPKESITPHNAEASKQFHEEEKKNAEDMDDNDDDKSVGNGSVLEDREHQQPLTLALNDDDDDDDDAYDDDEENFQYAAAARTAIARADNDSAEDVSINSFWGHDMRGTPHSKVSANSFDI